MRRTTFAFLVSLSGCASPPDGELTSGQGADVGAHDAASVT